ncbi:MAG: hypothetical protein NT029_09300 [Armatimonadetes bacterium]|nr:hypothetical protein [Armatimonadota bacterium]
MESSDTSGRAAAALRTGVAVTATLLACGLAAGSWRHATALLYAGLFAAILTPVARLAVAAHAEGRAGNRASVAATALTAIALAAAVATALAPRLWR